jgi:hypothetical protein
MRILLTLADAGVEFILVGGVAAVIQGVPLVTHDVDIVPRLTAENLDRMYAVLLSLHATLRGRPGPPLTPARHHLGPGHLLLKSDQGWLDVLGTLHGSRGWDELAPRATMLEVEGRAIRVLDLATIREIKAELATPRDQAHILMIDAVLARSRR